MVCRPRCGLQQTRVVYLAVLRHHERIVAILDVVTWGPGEGTIPSLVGDNLNIFQIPGAAFSQSESYRLVISKSEGLNMHLGGIITSLVAPPVHVKVTGLPAWRSAGQPVKAKVSAA